MFKSTAICVLNLLLVNFVFGLDPVEVCDKGYDFEFNEKSAIYVSNNDAIKCDAIKFTTQLNDASLVVRINKFDYDCGQIKDQNPRVICEGMANLVAKTTSKEFVGYETDMTLPKSDGLTGSLQIMFSLVTQYDVKNEQCMGINSTEHAFICDDNTCMFDGFRCNGVQQCFDTSDEANCTQPPKHLGAGWIVLIVLVVLGLVGGGLYYGKKRMYTEI